MSSQSSFRPSNAIRRLSVLLIGGLLALSGFAGLLPPTSVLAATTTASGTLAIGYGVGSTSFIVNVTSPCIFSVSGNPVSFATSPETSNITVVTALGTPGVGQQTLAASPTANAHNAGEVVTQTVLDCYPPLTITAYCVDNGSGGFQAQMTVTGGMAPDLQIELGQDAAFTPSTSFPLYGVLNPPTFTSVISFSGWPTSTIWVRWVADHSITASAPILTCGTTTTPAGSNIVVSAPPVTVTFATVGTAGTTTISSSSTAPALPGGYQLDPTTPPQYYDISTTAIYSGMIRVCISYGSTLPVPTQLLHWDTTLSTPAWVPIQDPTADPADLALHRICGWTTSLSPFALATKTPPASVSWAPTTSALGNTLAGPFSFATKIQARGNYITWKVDGGVALAGQTLQVWVYKKYSAYGKWIGPTLLTTRRANASGVAYLNIRTAGILWLSLRPVLAAVGAMPASWGPTSIGRWR